MYNTDTLGQCSVQVQITQLVDYTAGIHIFRFPLYTNEGQVAIMYIQVSDISRVWINTFHC